MNCHVCGRVFKPVSVKSKYCSKPCRLKEKARMKRLRRRMKKPPLGPLENCVICGEAMPEDAHPARKTCSAECKRKASNRAKQLLRARKRALRNGTPMPEPEPKPEMKRRKKHVRGKRPQIYVRSVKPKPKPRPRPEPEPDADDMWQNGIRVEHPKFGSGVVIEAYGEGEKHKARVTFDDDQLGTKLFLASYLNVVQ